MKQPSLVQIPWGVEVTWAILTPKNVKSCSKIKNIALGSIYSKPNSKKKTATLDHIAETYNFLNAMFGSVELYKLNYRAQSQTQLL